MERVGNGLATTSRAAGLPRPVSAKRGKKLEQPISRRTILTLAGSGLAGATTVLGTSAPALAERSDLLKVAEERGYRALTLPLAGRARIASTDAGTGSPA